MKPRLITPNDTRGAKRPRLRRWLPASQETGPVAPRIGPFEALAFASWFGISTGLLEVAILFFRKQFTNAAALGMLQMNRHAIWMIPVSEVTVFTLFGILLALVAWRLPAFAARVATYTCCLLAALAVLSNFQGLATVAYLALSGGLAAGSARWILAHWGSFRRSVLLSLGGLGIALTGLISLETAHELWSEHRAIAGQAPVKAGAPNVLLIVLDTVRAQSLSAYGYSRNTSPELAKLASSGVRFDRARASASWTLPSHASMFTGRWPHELSTRLDQPLDGAFPTLAEYLRDRGYATAGFVANTFFCNAWYGLNRGFTHYEDVAVTPLEVLRSTTIGRRLAQQLAPNSHDRPTARFGRKDGAAINRETLAWLDQRPKDQPFFLFLNYYDAHDPYMTSDEPDHPCGMRPASTADQAVLRDWHRSDVSKRSDREVALARDCYDDCIAELDGHLGRLFNSLDQRGLLDNTVVIVTSDHGEEFREHGGYGHGQTLHGEVIRVPLVISAPAKIPANLVVNQSVSLRDLPATVVDILDMEKESPFPGLSLSRCWSPSSPESAADDEPEEPVLTEILEREVGSKTDKYLPRSLVIDEKLYIRARDGHEELFDLDRDSGELNNLAGKPEAQPDLDSFRAALEPIDRVSAGPSKERH